MMNLERKTKNYLQEDNKMSQKGKFRISGVGTVVAGDYGDISISGSGKIVGDISCEALRVSGSCKSEGVINATSIRSSGSIRCEKDVISDDISISGSGKFEGDVKVKRMSVSGSFKSEEHYLNAERINISGSLKNELEINAELIEVSGKIDAKEIVGTTINILKEDHLFSITPGFFMFGSKRLTLNKAETITCETIFARNLKCIKLCAEDITLKNHSMVEYVECNGVLRMDSSCSVKQIEGTCEIIRE